MTYTLTHPTRTAPAMPYELLLGFRFISCGGFFGGLTALLQNLAVGCLCVLQMCCKSALGIFIIQLSKKIHTFVVRDLPNYFHYGANSITNKTETKTRGRRTVASTAVQLMLRMGESRSDLPSLFNFKSNVMRDSVDNEKLSFDAYVQERKRNSYEKDCWLEVKQGTDKLTLSCYEARKLRDKLTELLLVAYPPEYTNERQKKAKPYSYKWLKEELSKLIMSERFEEAEEVRQLIDITKNYEKQLKLQEA